MILIKIILCSIRWYLETAPSITIEYNISHRICEDNTDDESIIRLLPFLGIKGFVANRQEHDGVIEYNIAAQIKAVYSLDAKFLEEYIDARKLTPKIIFQIRGLSDNV